VVNLRQLPNSIKICYPSFRDHIPTRDALLAHSAEMFALIKGGRLTIEIGGRYPLAEAARTGTWSRARPPASCCRCPDPRDGSRAAAHLAGEDIPRNAVRCEDPPGLINIDRIGQKRRDLLHHLGESCPAQDVKDMLPRDLHRHS
jgi:hypothetical protein